MGAIATQKIAKPDLTYQRIFTESFWLVGPPNAEIPFSHNIDQTDLAALAQWLQAQPCISYSEDLPIFGDFGELSSVSG